MIFEMKKLNQIFGSVLLAAHSTFVANTALAITFPEKNGPVVEVSWRSSNSSFEGLHASLEQHYLRMANAGILEIANHTTLIPINFPSNYFNDHLPYLFWTDAIDNLLCDLNGHVCKRPRQRANSIGLGNTDHVMGNAITDRNQSIWKIGSNTNLSVPKISPILSSGWVTFLFDGLRGATLRDVFLDGALGCAVSPSENTTEVQDLGFLSQNSVLEIRGALQELQADACPYQIAVHNSYFLSYTAYLNGANESGTGIRPDEVADLVAESVSQIGRLVKQGETDAAWSGLDRLLRTVAEKSDGRSVAVRLPVLRISEGHWISDAQSPVFNLRPNLSWKEQVKATPLTKRLSNFDTSEYLLSIAPALGLQDEVITSTTRSEKLKQIQDSPFVGSIDGVGVRGPSIGAGASWTFNNAMSRPVDAGFANFDHFDIIGFDPDIYSAQTLFRGPIIFLENEIDTSHCVFVGNCDRNLFRILDLSKLSDLDGINGEDMRDRIQAVRNDHHDDKKGYKFHGLGVAAIATANPDSGLMHGIHPSGDFIALDIGSAVNWVESDLWTKRDEFAGRIAGPATWNISAQTKVKDNVRGLSRIINQQWNDPQWRDMRDLFVVSAGHLTRQEAENSQLPGFDCELFPGCLVENDLVRKSVLVVVGVEKDDNGNLVIFNQGDEPHSLMSFTNENFQIAAPAEGIVVPTIDPHFLAEVSGVSFAVPMVSGTIAALRSRAFTPASHIVARIMACAEQHSTLQGLVVAGVLDVGCSLTSSFDQVAFKKDVQGNDYDEYDQLNKGRVLGLWQNDLDQPELSVTVPFGGTDIQGDWAIRPSIDGGSNAVFGVRAVADRENAIKVTGLTASSEEIVTEIRGPLRSSLVMEFQPYDDGGQAIGEPVCFELNQLRGYIPALATVARTWERNPPSPRCPHR